MSDGTLDVSSGTHTLAGTLTTGENAVLALGAVTADSAALSATGDVTLSAGTIFRIDSYVEGAQLVSSSGTLTAAGATSGEVSEMGVANLYIGGYLVNQRGSATFSVSDSGVLTLDSYAEGANYSLTWNGGASGVWKANGTGWTTTDTTGEVTFQNGDSVTFGAGTDNSVTIEENLKVGTLTTSAATTLSVADGSAATVSASALSLGENLTVNSGVTLTLTGISIAKDNCYDASKILGSGTFAFSAATDGNGSGINLSSFNGDVYLTGGLLRLGDASYYSTFGTNASLRVANGAALVFNGTSSQGGANFSNDVTFEGNSTIHANTGKYGKLSGNVVATGTLTKAGAGELEISGTTTIGTLTKSDGTLTISGDGVKNITTLNVNGGTTTTIGGKNTNIGTLTQKAGTLNITAGTTTVGTYEGLRGQSVAGALTIAAGASMSVTGGMTLRWENENTTTLDVNGDLSVGGNLWISRDGNGIVNINDGGTVVAQTLTFGQGWNTTDPTKKSSTVNLGSGGVLVVGAVVANTTAGASGATTSLNTSALNLNGGTLGTSADSLTINVTSGSGSTAKTLSVVLGDGTTSTINTGKYDTATKTFTDTEASISIANVISGSGALKKTGAGTLTLSGANIYTGGTVIEGGELVASNASALGMTKGVEVKSGATLNLGTDAVAVAGLSGEGSVGLAAGTASSTLTVNSATDSTFSGSLSGAIALVKQGAGTLELSGTNMMYAYPAIDGFNPGVDVQAGTVRIVQTESNLQSFTNVSVADGATLELSTVSDAIAVNATSVVLSSTAKILVDMSNYASDADIVAVNLVGASALSYGGDTITSDNVDLLLGAIELKNWGDGWAQSLSYTDNTLQLTLTIPEPSVFGLLAGLGALALAGSRRRRRKA